VLQAVVGRQVQQPVGVEGVAWPGDGEVEPQPFGRRLLRHAVDHRLRLRGGRAVLGREPLDVGAVDDRRSPGVELEAAPPHVDVGAGAGCKPGQRTFEAHLADGTPRADHIGPDLDQHGWLLRCAHHGQRVRAE
jgi:hypothetical protein